MESRQRQGRRHGWSGGGGRGGGGGWARGGGAGGGVGRGGGAGGVDAEAEAGVEAVAGHTLDVADDIFCVAGVLCEDAWKMDRCWVPTPTRLSICAGGV